MALTIKLALTIICLNETDRCSVVVVISGLNYDIQNFKRLLTRYMESAARKHTRSRATSHTPHLLSHCENETHC